MYKLKIIKSFAAGIMLLLFALSITPKQILHDVITGHKHSYTKFKDYSTLQASKNNFQCKWHNQAVESPFIDQPDFQLDQPIVTHSSHINYYIPGYYSTQPFFSSLRGPPCQA